MVTGLISSEFVQSDYLNRSAVSRDHIDLTLVEDWAIEATQILLAEDQLEHKVDIFSFSNYTIPYPDHFSRIGELAIAPDINNVHHKVYQERVSEWRSDLFDGCEAVITIQCPECHKRDCDCKVIATKVVDTDWLRANAERKYWDSKRYIGVRGLNKGGFGKSGYHPDFTLMRPTTHAFFGTNYHIRGKCANLDDRLKQMNVPAYKPEKNFIRCNQEEGVVLFAWYAYQVDDDGYLLIPDKTEVFNALFWTIEAKMLWKNIKKDPTYAKLWSIADSKSIQYMREAESLLQDIPYERWMAMVRNFMKIRKYHTYDAQAGRPMPDKTNRGR
jgi:hypothetical protein